MTLSEMRQLIREKPREAIAGFAILTLMFAFVVILPLVAAAGR